MNFLLPLLILLLPFVLLKLEGKRKAKDFVRELSLEKREPLRSVWRSAKLFAAIFVAVFVLSNLLYWGGLLDTEKVVEIILVQSPLALFLAVSVGPIGEELLFRGYLQKRVGIIFSSVLFALLHYGYGSIAEVLAAFLVSMLIGLELRKSNDLAPCIIAHAAYNLFTIILVLHYSAII